MVSTAGCKLINLSSFPGMTEVHRLFNFDIVKIFLKTKDGRDRRPNFAVLQVWSTNYGSVKILVCEGSISAFSLYGQLAYYY